MRAVDPNRACLAGPDHEPKGLTRPMHTGLTLLSWPHAREYLQLSASRVARSVLFWNTIHSLRNVEISWYARGRPNCMLLVGIW